MRNFLLAAVLLLVPITGYSQGLVMEQKKMTVFGFLNRQDDDAVVTSGEYQYTLPWAEFIKKNQFKGDHKTRQARYELPMKHVIAAKIVGAEETR